MIILLTSCLHGADQWRVEIVTRDEGGCWLVKFTLFRKLHVVKCTNVLSNVESQKRIQSRICMQINELIVLLK